MRASIQENQCFLAELIAGNRGIYTIREGWSLSSNVDVSKLKSAFFELIKASDNLNRVFYFDDNSMLCSKPTEVLPLWSVDDMEFNMLEAPLICAGVYEKGNRKFFKIQFHHSLMDGWSLGLFMKDLENAYEQKAASYVNNSKVCSCMPDDFSSIDRSWKKYAFLADSTEPESDGTIFSLDEETTKKLRKESVENGTTLFPLLISKVSESIAEISNDTDFEYAIPFSARDNSNINDIGMFVDTQLLELETTSPSAIQNKLLELIANPNPIYKYSGSPKIMLNFLDMNILKFALSDDGYPISHLSKYALFDFQIEFRNVGNRIDVLITHKNGVLKINRNIFSQKIRNALSGEIL
ncbi:MAG: condensation domain-containing protein [Holosporaceae bacterium]|jgi:hypothetical protein|nr:condensation domain-containing protein [Holosporaceae bacterium]